MVRNPSPGSKRKTPASQTGVKENTESFSAAVKLRAPPKYGAEPIDNDRHNID